MTQRTLATAILFLLAAIFFLTGTANAEYREGQPKPKPHIIPGAVTIVFQDHVLLNSYSRGLGSANFGVPSLDKLLADFEVTEARYLFPWHKVTPPGRSGLTDPTRFYEINFPEEIPVQQVINALMQNPNVRLAEAVWALPLDAVPNDPSLNQQYAFNPGGLDPQFDDAWSIETGSDSIKYGAVDSGVLYHHPDLEKNIWVNPGEDLDNDRVVYDVDDLNGVDNDGNGVTDDLIGYDFLTSAGQSTWPGEDGGGADPNPHDFNGHGTHISGIAAEMTNNAVGGAGAAGGWFGGNRAFRGIQIMCCRVGYTASDGLGYVNSTNCGTAISYVAMNGGDVINCSWGSSGTSTMQVAMQDVRDSGLTICHAAGNDDSDSPDYMDFDPEGAVVLSVASVGANDVKSSFSNYGFWVDVSANGSNIYSTYSNTGTPTYASLYGTSMASPMVCGEALLIRSAMPSLTKGQVDSLIVLTTDTIDHLQNPIHQGRLGSGRINAYKALVDLASAKFSADVTDGDAPLMVNFSDLSPARSASAWWWSFGTGDSAFTQNPSYEYTEPGIYDVSLIVDQSNPLGYGEEHLNNYIWVRADTVLLDSIERELGQLQVMMPLYLNNSQLVSDIQFAFQFTNSVGVTLDSFSTAGLRTEGFYDVDYTSQNPGSQKYAILLDSSHPDSSHYLSADTGAVLKLYFGISVSATFGTVTIDTATVSGKTPYVRTIWGDFWPQFETGQIVIPFCDHGDVDCNGSVNIADLTLLVAFVFQGGGPVDPRGANVDGVGFVNVADITYLVAYLFQNGPPPPPSM